MLITKGIYDDLRGGFNDDDSLFLVLYNSTSNKKLRMRISSVID